jgi:transposase
MVKPLSLDLRKRIVAAVAGGMSRRKAAERFGVSPASAVRYCALDAKQGDARPRPQGGDRHSHKIEAHADFILDAVARKGDVTLVELRALCARARAIIWVEPGTHGVSRQLSALRDELRATFAIIAPCTHAKACPILLPENSRDWCHHFAPPPSEIFAQPDWVKFGPRAGIDLRSLPYCFFALDRTWNESRPSHVPAPADGEISAVPPDAPLSRIIGRPRQRASASTSTGRRSAMRTTGW